MQTRLRPLRPGLDDDIRVDRRELMDELHAAVETGENVLVLGGPGSGKTSALTLLVAELEEAGRPVAFVRGSLADSVHDLLALIWEALPGRDELPKGMLNLSGIGGLGAIMGPTGPSAEAVLKFARGKNEGVVAVAREIETLRRERPVTIVLDEVYDVVIAEELFGRARDVLWDVGHQWVFAAQPSQEAVLSRPPAGAFWGERVRNWPLSVQEAAEVLERRGFSRPIEAVLTGDGTPPQGIRELLVAAMSAERGDTAAPSHATGSAPQRALLDAMSGLDRPLVAGDEELLARLGWSAGYTSRIMRELADAGRVVEESERRTTPGRPRKLYFVNAAAEQTSR